MLRSIIVGLTLALCTSSALAAEKQGISQRLLNSRIARAMAGRTVAYKARQLGSTIVAQTQAQADNPVALQGKQRAPIRYRASFGKWLRNLGGNQPALGDVNVTYKDHHASTQYWGKSTRVDGVAPEGPGARVVAPADLVFTAAKTWRTVISGIAPKLVPAEVTVSPNSSVSATGSN